MFSFTSERLCLSINDTVFILIFPRQNLIIVLKIFRYFQGIPADDSSSLHIYSVKDDSASVGTSKDAINLPICLTCNLPEAITNYNKCTFSEATFSSRYKKG